VRGIKTTTISILALGLLAGSAVGVAAQDEEAAEASTPAYVTYEVTDDAMNVIDGDFDEMAGEMRGLVFQGVPVEASDPRLSGLWYFAINGNGQNLGTGDYGILESRSYRMENDGGAWSGTTTYADTIDPSTDAPAAFEAGILIGEGGYDGLIAYVQADYRDGQRGDAVILEVAVPPVPELPPAE
jgi:hypothetical protein